MNKLIEGSIYFGEDNLLFFKLEDRFVTISEKEISLGDILEESEVKRVMGKIREFFEAAETSSAG